MVINNICASSGDYAPDHPTHCYYNNASMNSTQYVEVDDLITDTGWVLPKCLSDMYNCSDIVSYSGYAPNFAGLNEPVDYIDKAGPGFTIVTPQNKSKE